MKQRTKKIIRYIGTALCVVYVLALMYMLFFSEDYGRASELGREYRYNLELFAEIRRFWIYREQVGYRAFLSNIFGNVVGFVPFGFILPIILRQYRNGFLTTLSGFGVSLLVETIQLLTRVGCFDVDDLLLNTMGAALGYLLFIICDHFRRKYYGKTL